MNTQDHKQALPPGFRLGNYRVVRVLGAGGFEVTYLCEHGGLGVTVAVKEYLPNDIAVRSGDAVVPKSAADREGYRWGLSRFLDEARTLARFEHRNVVRVRDYFEANGTAYIVMDYEDGEPLDRVLERTGTLTEAQIKRLLLPIVAGLRQVHAAGFLHRDVKPANIFIRRSDESPVLLDFGSARQALGRLSRSVTAIASSGYSPPEQYESNGGQGPWTDIYALSALCYRAITGIAPVEATRRQSRLLRGEEDPLPRLAEVAGARCSQAFLEAVDRGLRVVEGERQGSLDEWWDELEGRAIGEPTSHLVSPSARRGSKVAESRVERMPATKRRSRAVWLLCGMAVAVAVFLYFAIVEGVTVSVASPEAAPDPGMDPEGEEWRFVRNSGNLPTVRSFLERHPSGRFSGAARALLEQLEGAPFTIQTQPAEAQVRLLGHAEPYRAGMRLPAGEYRVEASAEGYTTATEIVAHGSSSTVRQIALRKAGPRAGDRFRDCPECPEMVVVPAGSYRMGSPSYEQGRQENEGPVHEVTIAAPFAIGVYEVTVAEFRRFVDETGYSAYSSCWTYEDGEVKDRADRGWRNPGFGQSGRHPVTCASWDDAQAYAAWLLQETGEEYRLPSESEWEYAARAGTKTARPWGEGESGQCRHANGGDASIKERYSDWEWAVASCRDGHLHTAPVGSFAANGWGLHDMLGNVWEWTEDCWNDSYAGAPSDGSVWEYGNCAVRVLRGGSWFNGPSSLRAANRNRVTAGSRSDDIGFRVARTLAP